MVVADKKLSKLRVIFLVIHTRQAVSWLEKHAANEEGKVDDAAMPGSYTDPHTDTFY